MLLHGQAREFVVLGIALVLLVAVDQVKDIDRLVRELRLHRGDRRVIAQRGGELFDQIGNRLLQIHIGRERIGIHARAARIGDVLLPLQHLGDGCRKRPACAEQIDLQHHQRLVARLLIE